MTSPPPLPADLAERLRAVAAALGGREAWLVGGAVRDLLLGRATKDIDLAVAGDALAVARGVADRLDGAFVPLDEAHQVARVVLTAGGGLWLDFSALQGPLREDLARRDCTINALALPLAAALGPGWGAHLVDPLGGRRDLQARLVRAASDAAFRADPARLLRALRLAAQLDFTVEPGTRRLLARDAALLTSVAAERLRDELCLLLATPRAYGALRELDALGLLGRLLPELEPARGVGQPPEHYWDVFEHLLHTVEAAGVVLGEAPPAWISLQALEPLPRPPELSGYFEGSWGGVPRATLLKLAALLHDVAKPETRAPDQRGRIRFLGHPDLGADRAEACLERLRFSRAAIQLACALVRHHLRPTQMSHQVIPSDRAVYRYFRDLGEAAVPALYLSCADWLATRGPNLELEPWRAYLWRMAHVLGQYLHRPERVAPPRLVDGNDLMAAFDLKPGPLIGRLLAAVQEAQGGGAVATRAEALEVAARALRRGGGRGGPPVAGSG
ncbi:MAG: HD domain-containing protein [Chloroflexi bacterium]|nr:HD domain-containing protein [Chloroflexota bacterium]